MCLKNYNNEMTTMTKLNHRNNVTIIGDSTIDNRIWVSPGMYVNSALDYLHLTNFIKRINKFRGYPKTVVENLQYQLPKYTFNDYTNDGFTTTDVLNGAYRDRIIHYFPTSFPHQKLKPLEDSQEVIKESKHIIVSIGGNNFREFLQKPPFTSDSYQTMQNKLKDEYLAIFKKIRETNRDAHIILMTQYYPSIIQNNYNIYPFMRKIGELVNIGGANHDPMNVIHEVVKQTYADVFKEIAADANVSVVDVTSSLNPYDDENHAHQIEPSIKGGKQIAEMLKYVIEANDRKQSKRSGIVYSFEPNFFLHPSTRAVNTSRIDQWEPKNPRDFIEEANTFDSLLFKIADLRYNYIDNDIYNTALHVHKEAKKVLKGITNKRDLENITNALQAVVTVLENPSKEAIIQLEKCTMALPHKKSDLCDMFNGSLHKFVGSALKYLGDNKASKAVLPTSFCKKMAAHGASIYNQGLSIFKGRRTALTKDISKLSDEVNTIKLSHH